jgi:hypothetical protein
VSDSQNYEYLQVGSSANCPPCFSTALEDLLRLREFVSSWLLCDCIGSTILFVCENASHRAVWLHEFLKRIPKYAEAYSLVFGVKPSFVLNEVSGVAVLLLVVR